jgi:phosphoglycolate phosphatase-like HAD superfamily hydrolase
LQEFGLSEANLPDYAAFAAHVDTAVGKNARDTVEQAVRLVYHDRPETVAAIDFDALYGRLNGVQDGLLERYLRPYPGLEKALLEVGKRGLALAFFTGGTAYHVVRNFGLALPDLEVKDLYLNPDMEDAAKLALLMQRMVERYGLARMVAVTADDGLPSKPDPAGVAEACKRLGVEPAETLMLGDLAADLLAAQSGGVPRRVGVTHGFDDAVALRAAGATAVIDGLGELPGLLV